MGLPPDWVSCHLYNDYEMSRKVQEKLGFLSGQSGDFFLCAPRSPPRGGEARHRGWALFLVWVGSTQVPPGAWPQLSGATVLPAVRMPA